MLDVGDRFALGGGIVLLKAIAAAGSVRNAAAEVGWSYRQALAYIKDAERAFGYQLVERFRGGSKHGGARLTRRGQDLVRRHTAVRRRLKPP